MYAPVSPVKYRPDTTTSQRIPCKSCRRVHMRHSQAMRNLILYLIGGGALLALGALSGYALGWHHGWDYGFREGWRKETKETQEGLQTGDQSSTGAKSFAQTSDKRGR